MLHITKGQDSNLIFTGTESCELVDPYFLFVFTNRATKDEVRIVCENISTKTERYDEVSILLTTFENEEEGFWKYQIYEQVSSSGTSTAGKNMVEEGFMYLHPASEFTREEYTGQDNSITNYNG